MKLSKLIDELKETTTYKKFKEENPSTFFSAGFFVLNLESKSEKIQLDFFLPNLKRVTAFEYPFAPDTRENTEQCTEPKIYGDEIKEMQPQTTKLKVDIDDIERLSKEIIKENNLKIIPTKIIAILQNDIWNLTCMDNFLGTVRIKINSVSGEQISFSKGSLMDMMKVKK